MKKPDVPKDMHSRKPVNRVAARVMRKGAYHIAVTEFYKNDGTPLRWQSSRRNPNKP